MLDHRLFVRLGPLSIQQKTRNAAKRTKFEKNKSDEKKPQEITEDDITRSGNETTKNVVIVCHYSSSHFPSWGLTVSLDSLKSF